MTLYRWVVDAKHPDGYAVEMTADEEQAIVSDQQAAAITTQQQTTEDTNADTIRSRLSSALANLEDAYTNWAALTNAQKDAALRLEVRVTIGLARLMIHRLDTAGV